MPSFFDIGTNRCEYFRIGSPDNDGAFIAGCHIDHKPVISARVYGPDGSLLFEILNNELTPRSQSTFQIMGFKGGWLVRDSKGNEVLSVVITKTQRGITTSIYGNIWDKNGQQICRSDREFGLKSNVGIALG